MNSPIPAYHVANPATGDTLMQGVHPGYTPEIVTAGLRLYLALEFPDLQAAEITLVPAVVIHPKGLPCYRATLTLDPSSVTYHDMVQRTSARLEALIGD